MKRNIYFILALLTFAFACEGPAGPPGPQGPRGDDGIDGRDAEEAFTFDYEAVDFTASNDYNVILGFPGDFQMLDSDVALTYWFWKVDEQTGLEVWRALPQTIFHANGIFQYNYDFTKGDVSVFLEANFSLNTIGGEWTDNNFFRVVVIPSQFENGRTALDVNDYYAVAKHFGLEVKPVSEKYRSIKRTQQN